MSPGLPIATGIGCATANQIADNLKIATRELFQADADMKNSSINLNVRCESWREATLKAAAAREGLQDHKSTCLACNNQTQMLEESFATSSAVTCPMIPH